MSGAGTTILARAGVWADNPERACVGLDTEAWFPEPGEEGRKSARRAKKICGYCPVHDDCLEYALSAHPRVFGIWGGTTERDRVEMRLQRKAMG